VDSSLPLNIGLRAALIFKALGVDYHFLLDELTLTGGWQR